MATYAAGGAAARGYLEVHVLPDLIDFSQVSYAKVFLSYVDPENGIAVDREVVFVADAEDPVAWKVDLKDDRKHTYNWRATFFMTNGSKRESGSVSTDDLTIMPHLP
jgi:hypothetical protein